MKASYKLALEQHQRRLNLTHKQLNKLDRKHNDINLIKYLMSLEPVSSPPPPENTGFYGTLDITPEKSGGGHNKDIYARLYYINTPLTNEITIRYPHTQQLTVNIADRLPDREAILTLRVRFEEGVTGVDIDAYDGWEPQGLTDNPLTENNYLSMLVNVGNVDAGILSITIVTSTAG
jgi:hypothetical protein